MDDRAEVVTEVEPLQETSSFEAFFEAERHRLHGALALMTANAQEAEEMTQDAFLKTWEHWDRVRDMDRPTGYLYRVAMNLFRARWRRMKLDLRPRAASQTEPDPFARIADQDQAARALALLPRRQRAALVLTEMLEFDSAEAAKLLKIKPATVRVLAHQARERLRREIGADDA